MEKDEIKALVEGLPTQEAIARLTEIIDNDPKAEEAYILRGMRYWSLSKRSAALTDYLSAIKLNPDSRANMLMKSAMTILDYYNKDLYNP